MQLAMTGSDWMSDRDRKSQARAEARRRKAALECARKLDAAAESLNEYMRACNDLMDGSEVKHAADGRLRLVEDLAEYSTYLESVFGK